MFGRWLDLGGIVRDVGVGGVGEHWGMVAWRKLVGSIMGRE